MRDDGEVAAYDDDVWAAVRVRVGLPPERPQLHTYPWL